MRKLSGFLARVSACAVLLLSLQAQAKTLVISDIDDTLKQSHVLDRSDMVANAVLTNNPFLGMNGVLIALKAEHPDFKFIYLTNAIEKMMEGLHGRFLSRNQFPEGPLLLRRSPFDNDFKITQIRKLLTAEQPTHVILIGDNGERDAAIYDQARKDFPAIQFLSYLHLAYSSKNHQETGAALFPGQIGYATSFDLLSHLTTQQVISPEMLARFYTHYGPVFLAEEDVRRARGAITIPRWMDCRDFVWNSPVEPPAGSIFATVKEKILLRCSSQPRFINEKRERLEALPVEEFVM